MVSGLEITGLDGSFRSYSWNFVENLRKHQNQIKTYFAVFCDRSLRWMSVRESLAQSSSGSNSDDNFDPVQKRIFQKLEGNDFDDNVFLTVQEQVEILISEATNVDNLCEMHECWFPLW